MTAFLSPPRLDCGDPVRVNGNRMAAPSICVNKPSKAAKGSGGADRTLAAAPHRPESSARRAVRCGQVTSRRRRVYRHAGLSNVSMERHEAASQVFKVATVQNRYNLVDRGTEDVLDYCEQRSVGFIPWFPLAAGSLAKPGPILNSIANAHHAAPSQIALAWGLKRSSIMFPIPGTSKVAHLEENVAAVDIQLSDEEFAALDRAGRKERAS